MCFSATASFSASALLTVTGVATMYKASNLPQKIFACIPFIFAFQQFSEGILWLSLLHPSWYQWRNPATYLFQIFAQVLWPAYIPLSVFLLETITDRKRVLLPFFLLGITLSSYTIFVLYKYPVHAVAQNHHILYTAGFPLAKKWYYGIIYFLPTVIAPIVSSIKYLKWFGVLLFASYIISRIFFHFYEISVWCFFGALISFTTFSIICKLQKSK
jgi:hypothetical protein